MPNEQPKYAIFRLAKLKLGWHKGGFQRTIKHLEKHTVSANIEHPELSVHNKVFRFCKNEKEEVLKVIKRHNEISKRKLRKDAPIAVEMVLSFSKKNMPINKWVNENYKWLKKEFPNMKILRIQLDMDETTPHLHVVGIPLLEDKTISVKKTFGGPKDFHKIQDSYAKAMEQFGLQRGLPKTVTRSKHKSLTRYRQEVFNEAATTLKSAINEAENIRSISEFTPDIFKAEKLQKEIQNLIER